MNSLMHAAPWSVMMSYNPRDAILQSRSVIASQIDSAKSGKFRVKIRLHSKTSNDYFSSRRGAYSKVGAYFKSRFSLKVKTLFRLNNILYLI